MYIQIIDLFNLSFSYYSKYNFTFLQTIFKCSENSNLQFNLIPKYFIGFHKLIILLSIFNIGCLIFSLASIKIASVFSKYYMALVSIAQVLQTNYTFFYSF